MVMSELAALIKESGAIKKGKFKLSDGSLSDYYIDKYVFDTDPEVLSVIADEIVDRIDEHEVDVLVGPALGAVPIVTAVSLRTGISSAYIRQGEKHYGTQARIEGTIEKGDRVAVIEDVTTTGGTIIESAEIAREVGGVVERMIVVVDRNAEAAENVKKAGFDLEYLTRVGEDFDIEGVDT